MVCPLGVRINRVPLYVIYFSVLKGILTVSNGLKSHFLPARPQGPKEGGGGVFGTLEP